MAEPRVEPEVAADPPEEDEDLEPIVVDPRLPYLEVDHLQIGLTRDGGDRSASSIRRRSRSSRARRSASSASRARARRCCAGASPGPSARYGVDDDRAAG